VRTKAILVGLRMYRKF